MNKKGEWFIVHGENFMSLQPQFCCSVCNNIISTSNLPNKCEQCGSNNEYKGKSISKSIESDTLETTPEYFARIEEDEMNVEKATYFLLRLGIRVKTECGNYRPTYDVLRDIGDVMSRANFKR